ncbi:MAG: haloalkane dehalogenase [Colwellia sp.]|nr:haloalkane dehalogenase [Colwellia sp.]
MNKKLFTKPFVFILTTMFLLSACNNSKTSKIEHSGIQVRSDFPYESMFVEVNGAKMHFVDTGGKGTPILMIHGQPTWSYLWRNVIPHLENNHRVIAVDLIGFGKSDKPNINYTIEEHAVYLEAFIQALDLKDLTLVVHDWGGFLGFDYAAKHPSRIKALAFMETVIPDKPLINKKPEIAPENMKGFAKILAMLSTKGVGEKMIYEDNMFIEQILPSAMLHKLSDDEMDAYREPFDKGKNRLPMLQFPREVGILGNASDYVIKARNDFTQYLISTHVPALLLTFSPGALVNQEKIDWVKNNMKNVSVKHIGKAIHFVQEDHPEAIGSTIAQWLKSENL